jgi:hypothetical protein
MIDWMIIEMMEEMKQWNDEMLNRGIDQIKWWIIKGVEEL